MALINLVNAKEPVIFGNDSVVIAKFNGGYKGGRALKMDDFAEPVVKAGHVIIFKDGEYMPLPLVETGDAYAAVPEGAAFAGVLYRTIKASKGDASIMFDGEVNIAALPYPIDAFLEEFKKQLPNIIFVQDEPYVTPAEEVQP